MTRRFVPLQARQVRFRVGLEIDVFGDALPFSHMFLKVFGFTGMDDFLYFL
ncbi:hypothetical protein OIU78_007685, partial [Salix suchowensis]